MKRFCLFLALLILVLSIPTFADENTDLPTPVPTASPEPTTEPIPDPTEEPLLPTVLYIDNGNLYENMARTYAQGYIPTVQNGRATVVLPLVCDGALKNDQLRAAVVFTEDGPFVSKNYEKTVKLANHKVNGGKSSAEAYLISFPLQLKADRYNGSYSVILRVTATAASGEQLTQDFPVSVTITDGKDPDAVSTPEPVPEEEVILTPKVLVESYSAVSLSGDGSGIINAGEKFRVSVTLKNTSKTQALENMTVTAAGPDGNFQLNSAADTLYIPSLPADGSLELSFDYTATPETPASQYEFPLTFDFAYGKGLTGSGAGSARVEIAQPLKLEFSVPDLPAEAVISDTIEVTVQAINLSHSKARNVRATIEADGFLPAGTAFIGDLEGGSAMQVPLQIRITGLTQGNFSYGQTVGTVTYYYEDDSGVEHSLEEKFTVNIKSPFSGTPAAQPDDPGQWWIIMAVIGGVLAVLSGVLVLRAVKRRSGQ